MPQCSSLCRLLSTSFLTAATLLSINTHASTIDVALSNDMIELEWQEDLGSNLSGGLSFLHADTDDNGKQKTDIISGDFFLNGKEGMIEYQMGSKLYFMKGKKTDAHGALLGGALDVNFTTKFYVDASAFYSPDIINGGDFEQYIEAKASIGFKPTTNAKLYIGYKYTEASQGKFEYEPYQGIMFGFGARF